MYRCLLPAFAIIPGITLSGWTMAGNTHDRDPWSFTGLWQTIDSFDGSAQEKWL